MPSVDNFILAAVSLQPEKVQGGLPVFKVADAQELQSLANMLAHILDGMVHDLGNDTLIIVRH